MKRLIAAAALVCAFAVPALAQAMGQWVDPANTFSFSRPSTWPVDRMGDSSDAVTHYAAGLADAECNFYSIVRAATAESSPQAVKAAFSAPLTAEQWAQVTSSIRTFRAGATVQSSSVDTSHFWPIQRAALVTGGDTVQGAIIGRPGREIWVFCQSYDSRDRTSVFEQIISSVATPRDAEWQAAAEAAAQAPPPPAEPAAPPAHGGHH